MRDPCYADGTTRLYHGPALEVLAELEEGSADLVLTDPPYALETAEGARTLRPDGPEELVPFAFSEEELLEHFAAIGRVARRWVVAFVDWRHVHALATRTPAGLRFVRHGVWIKRGSAPQFSGDRPGPGWEAIAILHRTGGRMKWNGGGRSSVWEAQVARGEGHPTAKPLELASELVRLFSDPGELVLDPFAGSGAFLRAAKDNGRRAVGIELDAAHCARIARRMRQEVFPFAAAG